MNRLPSLCALVALAACGSDPVASNDTDNQIQLVLTKVSGDSQVARVVETLPDPLVIRVMNGTGVPVPGVVVNFVVATEGGGEPWAGAALTDTLGQAAERWLLGQKAGTHRMEIRRVLPDGTPVVEGFFEATAEPGDPYEFYIDRANLPSRPGTSPSETLYLRVGESYQLSFGYKDEYGNPGAVVVWTSTDRPEFDWAAKDSSFVSVTDGLVTALKPTDGSGELQGREWTQVSGRTNAQIGSGKIGDAVEVVIDP